MVNKVGIPNILVLCVCGTRRARDVYWEKKEWPSRIDMTANEANIINEPLVPRKKIIIPPLYIKLGLMKQFVKALPVDGCCFNNICNFFPGMSNEKLKAEVFDGTQIRKIMRDSGFVKSMTVVESAAWISFSLVVKKTFWETPRQTTIKRW